MNTEVVIAARHTLVQNGRARSAPIMTVTRGSRSTSGPASGASTSTGTISAIATRDTPSPEPVR